MKQALKVGVISDTHGLLRPEALAALGTVDHIIHAGDIGSPAVLEGLSRVAPVTAVRGNVDTEEWAGRLPATAVVELGGLILYVIHDVHELDLDPRAAGFAALISRHSHRPAEEWRDCVLYFNPGSAGPRRFRLPLAVGFLTISGKKISSEIVLLSL